MRWIGLTGAALALTLAACGGGSSGGNVSVNGGGHNAPAPNPVDILKLIPGCRLSPGETQGDHDVFGNRMAECNFEDNGGSDGTDVLVYTNTTRPDLKGIVPDDSHKIILGSNFIVEITGDFAAYSAHVDPDAIASEVGGTVQQ